MVSWMIASIPFGQGFIDGIKSQCHMPFYYFYLKFVTLIFGNNDLVLRLSSVFAGVLSIISMYFVGKEKDLKTGYYCAGFTAISSFLVYYSQEVRLYSLLFLFSSLSLLFTIRLIKNQSLNISIFYILSNFLILITHTIGFVYVILNLIFVSVFLFKSYKKQIFALWLFIFTLFGIITPLIINVFFTKSFSQWWGHFSVSKIGFLFTDYFSPVLSNLTNAPDNFFYMPHLAAVMLIPAIIAIALIVKSVINNKFNLGLLILVSGYIFVLIAASLAGKLVFITKYSIEIYPALIFLACYGLSEIKNNVLKNITITVYCAISLGFIFLFPYSAPKMHRAEGHKIVADLINNTDLKDGDFILLEYYNKERFEKYFDFSKYNVISINKGNFPEYLTNSVTYQEAYKNGKTVYKKMFLSDNNRYLHDKLQKEIFVKLG